MRIDTHAHLYPQNYLDLLETYGVTTTGAHRGLGADTTEPDLDARFALMDEAGVQLQVLSASPMTGYLPDEQASVSASRMINDCYAGLVAEHPDRFRAFATVPLPHLDAALAELDRALGELGMLGVALTTTVSGLSLTDPVLRPFWEELDRRGTVAFLHPSGDACGSPQIDGPLRWLVGAPVEDTVAAAKLITQGYVTTFPHVRVLNSHFGGAVPLLLERWDNLSRLGGAEPEIMPSEAARRMWYDTVCHGSSTALRAGVAALGADRLVLGSDFPYQNGDLYTHGAVGFIREAGLTEDDAHRILDVNAARLLGLTAPST
jgi:predicted TIM-barrel fold metal-dependent hydrolase